MIFERTGTKSVKFECYRDIYQLTDCNIKDGNHVPQYAKYQNGYNNYPDKARPIQVKIGTKEQVIQMCLAILQEVTGMEYDEKLPI